MQEATINDFTVSFNLSPILNDYFDFRAACFMKLMEFQRALEDCDACIKKDPKFS